MKRSLPAALTTLALVGCGNPQDDARERLRHVDIPTLRMDAARVYKQVHALPGPEFLVIRNTQWPESFKKLRPRRVGAYRDGIVLALDGDGDRETGLHILPTTMERAPVAGRGRYEKLADGVYWYTFTQ